MARSGPASIIQFPFPPQGLQWDWMILYLNNVTLLENDPGFQIIYNEIAESVIGQAMSGGVHCSS